MFFTIFVALSFFGLVSSANPGVKARLTQNGLTYANSVAQAALAKELKTLAIPDQRGKDGHIEWEFTHIQNRGVTVPTSQISFDPAQNGLQWTINNLGINLHADWRIKYRKGWVKASTSGSVDLGVHGINLNVAIRFGKDSTGRPSVKTASCSAHVGDVDLDFHGGAGWLINMFKHPLERRVQDMLQDQICKVATKEVDVDGEKDMAKLKVVVEVAKLFLLDYRLTAAPIVTATSLELPTKGEVYWKADVKEAPYTPQPIPPLADSSRMFYMWLTEYSAQTFAYSAQMHDFLKKNISKDDLPPGKDSYLNTTCKLTCIGKLIPQIGQKYPNCQVRVAVRSTAIPNVTFATQGIGLAMQANIDMFAESPNKKSVYLLTLSMNLNMSVNASVVHEKLVGKVTSDKFNIGIVKSAVGKLDPTKLTGVFNLIMALAVIPEINEIGAKGIDLPMTGEVQFKNTVLKLLQGSLMIGTDLTYTPSALRFKQIQLQKLQASPSFKVVGA